MPIHIGTTKDENSAFDTTCHSGESQNPALALSPPLDSRLRGNDNLGGRIPIFVAMTRRTRSGVHPEGFSSGDITGTTLKGVKRGASLS